LERLPNLEVLVIENNHLSELPFDIYKAKKLRIISFRGNQIQRLPDSISQLENLTVLDLRGNPLSAEELEKLKILLPGCQIRY
jgi:Leucine-rich repeat (LRR) protein